MNKEPTAVRTLDEDNRDLAQVERMFDILDDEQKDAFLEALRAMVADQEERKRKEIISDVYGFDIDEMLKRYFMTGYLDDYTGYLFDAWEKKTKATTPEYGSYQWCYIQTFFFPFLFECGKIYGIRMERKRRK